MVGTTKKVDPCQHSIRRLNKVRDKLGDSYRLYSLLLEEIDKDGNTSLYLEDAANRLHISLRTVKRDSRHLVRLGFVTATHTKRRDGGNGYCRFHLPPINDLIDDYGDDEKSKFRRDSKNKEFSVIDDTDPRVIDDTAKRSKKNVASSPSSRPVSPSQNEVAEAVLPASASSISIKVQACDEQGFDIDIPDNHQPTLHDQILSWSAEHVDELIGYGFKHRDHTSLANDIEKQYVRDDPDLWHMFLASAWPRLQIMLPGCTQALNRMNVGPGWMFKFNQKSNQPNFMDLILTTKYRQDGFRLPETIYPVGTICFDTTINQNMRIVGYTHRAYQVCFVSVENPGPSDIHGLGVWDAKEQATPLLGSASSPETIFVPSPSLSGPRELSGAVPTPPAAVNAPEGLSGEDEELARRIREMCFAD